MLPYINRVFKDLLEYKISIVTNKLIYYTTFLYYLILLIVCIYYVCFCIQIYVQFQGRGHDL